MRDPLSAIICGFLMEDLEAKTTTSAPEDPPGGRGMWTTFWKRSKLEGHND